MKNVIVILSALFLMSCGGAEVDGEESVKLDQSKPENLMNIMFQAAKSGDFSQLKDLCHPDADMDGDVKDVCSCGEEGADPEMLASYKEYFSKGEVTETRMIVDEAEVDFNFGPDGTKKETMRMIEIDGKWYLKSF
jgi:hypothetical protein